MSPKALRFSVWARKGSKGKWSLMAFAKTKKAAETQAKKLAKRKGIKTRVDDRNKPLMQPGGKVKKGPPKSLGGKWRDRKTARGYKARQILKGIRSERTKSEILTAVQLARSEEMDQSTFVNFVQSLNLSGSEAYTFWFSPP
jgi:hypothetical protein